MLFIKEVSAFYQHRLKYYEGLSRKHSRQTEALCFFFNSYLHSMNLLLEFEVLCYGVQNYHGSTRIQNGMQPLLLGDSVATVEERIYFVRKG